MENANCTINIEQQPIVELCTTESAVSIIKEPWLSLKEKSDWQYCAFKANRTVCILPYHTLPKTRVSDTMLVNINIYGRYEDVPCHDKGHYYHEDQTGPALSSFTGTIGQDELPSTAALRELREEAGYLPDSNRLIDLGFCYPSKAADQIVYLFAADVSNLSPHAIIPDGSAREATAKNSWMTADLFLNETNCPIAGLAFSRLLCRLNSER